MAKSGQIQLLTGTPGDLALADSVVFTESTPTNLGGVVADLLDKSSDALKIVVDPVNRQIFAFPASTDVTSLLSGTFKNVGTITRDDPTRRSSPVTRAAVDSLTGNAPLIELASELDASFAASKPSKNAASIVNAVEDALAAMAKLETPLVPSGGTFVILDQTGDGSVKVYSGSTNTSIDPDSAALIGATAMLKQIQQSESTVTPLAFE